MISERYEEVLANAQGNPLFLEEFSRAFRPGALDGTIERQRRQSSGVVDDAEFGHAALSSTIEDLISARLDSLSLDGRRLLELAAVIGETVPRRLLSVIIGSAVASRIDALDELIEGEFLARSSGPTGDFLVFSHGLLREVCYDTALKSRRRELHAMVMEAYEILYEERLDEFCGELAKHSVIAEIWDKAAHYNFSAAQKAQDFSSFRSAHRYFDTALSAIEKLPKNEDIERLEVDVHLAHRATQGALGLLDDMRKDQERAEALLRGKADTARLCAVKTAQTFANSYGGDLGSAIAAGEIALELSLKLNNPARRLAATYHLAQAKLWSGAFQEVVDLLSGDRDLITGELRTERLGTAGTTSVLWLGHLGAAQTYRGNFDAAHAVFDQMRQIGEATGRPYDRAMADFYMGFGYSYRGEYRAALGPIDAAEKACAEATIPFLVPVILIIKGYALGRSGQPKRAQEILDEAVGLSDRTGLDYAKAWSRCYLAQVQVTRGALDAAADTLSVARGIAEQHGYRGVLALAHRLGAEAALAAEPPRTDDAAVELDRAADLAREAGMEPEMAICEWLRADILDVSGIADASEETRAAAAKRFKALGMKYPARSVGWSGTK